MVENLRTYLQSIEGQPVCVDIESMCGCLKQYENMAFHESENYIVIGDQNTEDECFIDKRKIQFVCSDFMSCIVIGKGTHLEIHQ